MKKITSLLLCMVLVLSMFCGNAVAAERCMEVSVTVSDDGAVTVAVAAKEPAANARLTVDFDSDYLTYVDCETPFAVHSVKAQEGKLIIGLANPSSGLGNEALELAVVHFRATGRWDTTDITVTAEHIGGKQVNESVTLPAQGSGYRFQDVEAGTWYYEAVEAMAAEGYIRGISDTHFGPGLKMNRASFVTLLGRLEGVEEAYAETRFADVPVESFYSGYVAWADEKQIVEGISENLFAPAKSMSREQMVTFLYRYAVSEGMDVSVADGEAAMAKFPDAGSVSLWAADAFAWAIDRGVINGMDGILAPQGICNRAKVAVMLYRFFFEGGSR